MEYYDPIAIIKREQYYINSLKPKYNILKVVGPLSGFIHSEAILELMREVKLGHNRSEEAKLSIGAASATSLSVLVTK